MHRFYRSWLSHAAHPTVHGPRRLLVHLPEQQGMNDHQTEAVEAVEHQDPIGALFQAQTAQHLGTDPVDIHARGPGVRGRVALAAAFWKAPKTRCLRRLHSGGKHMLRT